MVFEKLEDVCSYYTQYTLPGFSSSSCKGSFLVLCKDFDNFLQLQETREDTCIWNLYVLFLSWWSWCTDVFLGLLVAHTPSDGKKNKNKKNPISYKTHELFSNSFVQCNFYGICIGSQGYTLIHFWAIQTLKLSGFSPNTGTSTHSTLLYLHVRSLKYFSWNQWFHAQRQQKDISSFREFTSGKKAKCRGGTRKKVQASLMMC